MAELPNGLTEQDYVLPDVLEPDLKAVFCGMAAGKESAKARAYYAKPGNRFWLTLHATGLTPLQIIPRDFPTLPKYGLGLTDLFKFHSGNDKSLPTRSDIVGPLAIDLETKIKSCAPRILAFTGKESAKIALNALYGISKNAVRFGPQEQNIGTAKIWVLPSTSGLNGHWENQKDWWQKLADQVR